MKKAPVSVCIIVKNEPLLENCLLSVKDFVEEIVVVDTGSTDNTPEVAKKFANIFEIYTGCNDKETGLINDFSNARQRSFDLATQKWVMWLDADDIIVGMDKLQSIIDEFEKSNSSLDAVGYLFPYEYSYNEAGQCTCLHYRERLFSNKKFFHWFGPVHEVVIPNDGAKINLITREELTYKHGRQYSGKMPEQGRNLRILRKWFEDNKTEDARMMYYLGLECTNAGLIDEAVKHLSRYIEISGWDDERAMASLKLFDIYAAKGDWETCLKWGFKTIEIQENWGEGYFALAKAFYQIAARGGHNERRFWERCVHYARTGLRLPPTKTLLFVNPLDREYEIHRYLNFALNKLGDVRAALASAMLGLQKRPDDLGLLGNKKLYEDFLARDEIVKASMALKNNKTIDELGFQTITAIINNQPIPGAPRKIEKDGDFPIAQVSKNTEEWNIPETFNFDGLPLKMTEQQLQASVIMMWKQYMLKDEMKEALTFLENTPYDVRYSVGVQKAINLTKECLNSQPVEKQTNIDLGKLDIVFYIGNGVEEWTPETVKKTGIGGSELMAIEMTKRLASQGHRVRVFNSCGNMEGTYDGVEYYQSAKYKDLVCDVLVVSRQAEMLDDTYNITRKLTLLWLHDVCAINATSERLLKADKILVLSEWHKQNVINVHSVSSDQIIVTRNGIDLTRFAKEIKRNKFKCVNSSSPDRSWPVLLEVWPEIRKQVPEAELHLFYGFKNWEFSAQRFQGQPELIARLKQMIEDYKSLGVVYHDRVSQQQLAEEFLSAGAWIHPTWFTETSCITAMEAQAAGLRMITSNIGALKETAGNRAILIDGEWTSTEYKNKFVSHVIEALKDDNQNDRTMLQQYAKENFSLDTLAQDWSEMFYGLLNEKDTNPIVEYHPTVSYR